MARGARMRGVQRRASRFKKGHTDALWYGTREIAHTPTVRSTCGRGPGLTGSSSGYATA